VFEEVPSLSVRLDIGDLDGHSTGRARSSAAALIGVEEKCIAAVSQRYDVITRDDVEV
jgi:hypothetical protein